MILHLVERALVMIFFGLSVRFAVLGQWGPANYFMFLAAFVNFEDWTSGGRG
jgi:hypothetical protein